MAIDFRNIKEYDGSKDKGFEELVCQLAHLQVPEKAVRFIRKEGDGGDAGVECYWVIEDKSEYAWQAKYFMDTLSSSQWTQINESVTTAIDKHPNLCKYYVCMPRDFTDSRKKVKGKVVNSAFDKWQSLLKEWTTYTNSKGMNVEFIYWGKHEMCKMLQTDDPAYSGKVLYWFNAPSLTSEKLLRIANRSKESLGERFTPEYHVDLPIAKEFDGLGHSREWRNILIEKTQELNEAVSETAKFLGDENDVKYNDLISRLYRLRDLCQESIYQKNYEVINSIVNEQYKLSKVLWEVSEEIANEEKSREKTRNTYNREKSSELREYIGKLSTLNDFMSSRVLKLSMNPSMLLLGNAGIGKSHLLCDVVLRRLQEKLPTLFLLGQSYPGGDPIDYMKSELNLSAYSNDDFLGALDSFGEGKNSIFLIVIDAINEGTHKKEWYDHIVNTVAKLKGFYNIGIVLSCRSTYKDFIVPKELTEDMITTVNHVGFSGHEHRAAMVYLAGNGISVPSAPILNPEFSNPLFLKTCVKAIKNKGETTFPKGLNGFIELFEFYTNSIDEIIKRKKLCRRKDNLVLEALGSFAKSIFPDSIEGLTYDEAKSCINNYDPSPNIDISLMELLIDEGVLATDIAYSSENPRGIEVIRFTYERFCDFFIAEHILKGCDSVSKLKKNFSEGDISVILKGDRKYSFSGVIEALGIIIPERFKREFMEFYSAVDEFDEIRMIENTFHNTILWRTGASISEKSLELLNTISNRYHDSPFKVLVSVAVEPEHPWNAEFLHNNLYKWAMNERDSMWSTFIAVNDYSDEEDYESITRKIMDWTFFFDLKDVGEETLWLTAIVLAWFTSTSNRKTRDQATKSLARVLCHIPRRIVSLMVKFSECDDFYVIQRIYGAVYGTVTNISDISIVKEIGEYVIEKHFANGQPYPDLLFRDFICGIVEYANHCNAIEIKSDINDFRPPFESDWHIENPTKSELESLVGDKFASSIRSSTMGFPGDFGNYTMGCVHNWAAKLNEDNAGKTGIDVWMEFKEKLPSSLHYEYDLYIQNQIAELHAWQNRDMEIWIKNLTKEREDIVEDKDGEIITTETPEEKSLEDKIKEVLDEKGIEEFRWLSGIRINDAIAPFSRKWAQRWVCKKAFSLGWENDLFEEFERIYSNGGKFGRYGGGVERIGKKYQWIALHELLARMSDNLPWIDRGYSDLEDSIFYGPWQVHCRDIDPTLLLRRTEDNGWLKNIEECWWSPYKFTFSDFTLDDLNGWLWSTSNLPNINNLLNVRDSNDESWLVLRGFNNWNKKPKENKDKIPYQDAWYRINSCIVHKADVDSIKSQMKGKSCASPDIIGCPSTGHQGYYGEYPWHRYYSYIGAWENDAEKGYHCIFDKQYHIPVCEYEWEKDVDHSIDSSIRFYMPSPLIISELNLHKAIDKVGAWNEKSENTVFIDPSTNEKGPSYGMIKRDIFVRWLEENDYVLLFLIGGEKQLFTDSAREFFGRHIFSGVYYFDGDELKGDMWFIEERPR